MNIFENFDRLSFWLGFIASSLVWYLVIKLRKHWVPIKDFVIRKFKTIKIQRSTSIDGVLRQEVLRRAQNSHLAQSLFSLDEVLIVPKLLAPAKKIDPVNPDLIASAQPVVLPNLPLVPQFSAQYSGETLALPRLLRMGANIAIAGHPGMGKSTTLAYLATLFSRKDVSLGPLSQHFPIYVHFNDLFPYIKSESEPIKVLSKALSWHVSATQRPQLSGFIQKQLQDNRAILLLDGLDEVPYAQYHKALGFLSALLKSYPKLRVVTTASFDRAYGMIDLGIEPMPIAGWTRTDITHFINRWGGLWKKHFTSNGNQSEGMDELLLNQWQAASVEFFSPLEWTTRIWGAYAGDLVGSRGADAVATYAKRLQSYGVDVDRLASLADRMLANKQGQIQYIEAEKFLSEIVVPAATPASEISFEPGNLTQNEVTFQAPVEPDKPTGRGSIGERTINILLEYGLLREGVEEHLSFTSPVVWGYLSSLTGRDSEFEPNLSLFEPWSVISEALHFRLLNTDSDWLKTYLTSDKEPFYTRTIQAGLWMHDLPPKDPNRAQILRYILQHARNEDVPYNTQLSLLAAASMSNDPSVLQLMRQLAESPSSTSIRQIAILCSGMLRDSKAFNYMISALNDPDLNVRWASCFALAALETADGRKAAKTVMDRSDEPLRLATAEALASRPPWGHDLLKLAETSPDMLTRQAMIFGLLHLRTPWAIDILERVSSEDSQWAVRNFAGQALQYLQKTKRHNNKQFLAPSDSPWLIAYSSRQGHGVPKGNAMIPLLLEVLNSGSDEEKIAAIQLLARFPDKAATDGIKSCLTSQDANIRRAAYDSLWLSTLSQKPASMD